MVNLKVEVENAGVARAGRQDVWQPKGERGKTGKGKMVGLNPGDKLNNISY